MGTGGLPVVSFHLCGYCGTVAAESAWTYWHRPLDDDATGWVPARQGEEDPMAKCPGCGWEHQDCDYESGYYEGTLAEMRRTNPSSVSGGPDG